MAIESMDLSLWAVLWQIWHINEVFYLDKKEQTTMGVLDGQLSIEIWWTHAK